MHSSIKRYENTQQSRRITYRSNFILHATLYSLNMQKEGADGEKGRKVVDEIVREISKCKRLE